MATTADEPTFVDTNILVYANSITAPLHARARQALTELFEAGGGLWTSRQVLREYLATLSRPQPFSTPVAPARLIEDVGRFLDQFQIGEDGELVTENLLTLIGSVSIGGKQMHDANIVATMQAHSIRRLLTHNLADFARFVPMIEVIPLERSPPRAEDAN